LAVRAADFVLNNLVTAEGRLLRSFHRGIGSVPAFVEDYAFLVHGLLELYERTLEIRYRHHALRLNGEMLNLFKDPLSGGLMESGSDAEIALVRTPDDYDGVTPSGTAIAVANMVKLARMEDDQSLEEQATSIIRTAMASAKAQPLAHLALLSAYQVLLSSPIVATVSIPGPAVERQLFQVLSTYFLPNMVIRHGDSLAYPLLDGNTTIYLCINKACRPPVSKESDLRSLLENLV
jgi:uncharacterized protein YyaL (SSP411 family)